MLLTTTDQIDGHSVAQYLSIVTGEAVFATSVFAGVKSGIKDLMGGQTESYAKELEAAKNQAMVEMVKEARILNAHAIVGIDIDYMEFLGKYFMVIMSGTAVRLAGVKDEEMPASFVMPTEKPGT